MTGELGFRRVQDDELNSDVATPWSATSIKLLGRGALYEGISLTREELAALQKVYDFEPVAEDEPARMLVKAGNIRNLLRYVQHDGIRVMAVLAKLLEPGEDPVKLVVRLMSDAGYDCSDHAEWAFEEESGDEAQ